MKAGPRLPASQRHWIRNDAVARALEDMRGDRFNRGTKAQFTWSGRSKYVKVAGVHVTTTSGKSKTFRLELEVEETPQDALREMSINGKSPADLTEMALRSVLFGESNPLADQHMGFARLTFPIRSRRCGKARCRRKSSGRFPSCW